MQGENDRAAVVLEIGAIGCLVVDKPILFTCKWIIFYDNTTNLDLFYVFFSQSYY